MSDYDSVIAKEWRKIEEDVDRSFARPMSMDYLKCMLSCFDKAGSAWSAKELEECKQPCHQKSQVKQMIIERECGELQKRFQMALNECQYKLRDDVSSQQQQQQQQGLTNKQRDVLYQCETKAMQELGKTIRPMKDRIRQNIQQFEKEIPN